MADAKKGNAAKEFFEKFGEKLALIIALVILVGYGVIAFGMGDDETQLKEVEKNKREIEKEQKTPHKDMTAPDSENWQARLFEQGLDVIEEEVGEARVRILPQIFDHGEHRVVGPMRFVA